MTTPTPVRSGFRISGPEDSNSDYAHPPVVEAWLSVEFEESLSLVDKTSSIQSALGPEWLGAWKTTFAGSKPGGLELTNVMGDLALRVTSRGFAFGWLGYSGERYPRYEAVRDGFVTVLDAVRSVLGRTGRFNRWAVRYVNRIPQGTVWNTPGDWGFFSLWDMPSVKGLGIEPISARADWQFPLEAERGILDVEFRHQPQETPDAPEYLWISLQVGGAMVDDEISLFDGFDYGREVIVRSFNELVSPAAKSFWGVSNRPR